MFQRRSVARGSGTSSAVTSHGPTGTKVSQPLPLSHCPLELVRALRNIVHDAVASDVLEAFPIRNVFCPCAYDHAELDISVELFRAGWNVDVIVSND
jgi:hypothetical protein